MKLHHFLIFFLGTLSPDTGALIPTVTDNAFAEGIIASKELGISFDPTAVDNVLKGEITWGIYTFINYIIRIIVLTDVIQVELTPASTLAKLLTCMYFALNPY